MTWQMQEAKNRLSEVVSTSLTQGPQIISRRGKNTAIVMSYAEFQQLTKPPRTFKELVQAYHGVEMPKIDRDRALPERATPTDFNDIDV